MAADKLTVIALGDSTTAGTPYFFSPLENPPAGLGDEQTPYTAYLQRMHPNWVVLNQGIRGQRTDQILARFKEFLKTHKADCVIVLAGVNDFHQGASLQSVKNNLTSIYELSQAKGMRVVACTILPYNLARPEVNEKIAAANLWIKERSQAIGLIFCDTFHAVENPSKPFHLRGSPDDIHPDKATYHRMGQAINDVLPVS